MAKKPAVKNIAEATGTAKLTRWGGNTKAIHVPSGRKLVMTEDEDCILVFIGKKDISDKCGKEAGEVVYNIFHDGKRLVSLPMSYALADCEFKPDHFYYLHVAALIPNANPSFNDMKDFEVIELGAEGESVQADPDRTGTDQIELTLPTIADLNYTKMNYTLRKK